MPQVVANIVSTPSSQPSIEPSKATSGTSWTTQAANGDDASCSEKTPGDNGASGNDGGDGSAGQDGVDGTPAGNVAIRVNRINGQLTLSISGGNASNGQDGGDGGTGQQGGNGGASANCSWGDPNQNGGVGGNGGNGGNGGDGGNGGNGGDGPIVSILYTDQPSDTPSIYAVSGSPGGGGNFGQLGVPGNGGRADGGSGEQAASGNSGTNGSPGNAGNPGIPSCVTMTFGAPLPTLTSISPAQGPDGTVVTIKGDYFQNGAQVMIGDNQLGAIEVVSTRKIRGTIPACPRCFKVCVKVTNPDEGCAAVEDMYTYY